MARPRKQIDPQVVVKLAAQFHTVEDIARFVGADPRTIQRRFATELESGRAQWRGTLRGYLRRACARGEMRAIEFMACQPEWRGGLGMSKRIEETGQQDITVSVRYADQLPPPPPDEPALERANGADHSNGNGALQH